MVVVQESTTAEEPDPEAAVQVAAQVVAAPEVAAMHNLEIEQSVL